MLTRSLLLTRTFAKIFLRDRQAIMFMVVFPIMFMLALGMGTDYRPGPVSVGLVDSAHNDVAQEIIHLLQNKYNFILIPGTEEELTARLHDKTLSVIVMFPETVNIESGTASIQVIQDSSQFRQTSHIISSLQQAFAGIERDLRDLPNLFELNIEDIQPRPLRYIDFLLPGILAMTLMQISIAGSGFNLVEYRRKGILKRLFVTPLKPGDFITGVVFARLLLCLIQITVLIGIAVLFLNVDIVGNVFSLYLIVVLGSIIFLCVGFTLGSLAKTQQSIQAIGNLVIFPQVLFSGIFYPIDSLPEILQPIATVLPLSFIASALREITTNGLSLLEILPDLFGIAVWLILGFLFATRLFVWKDIAG